MQLPEELKNELMLLKTLLAEEKNTAIATFFSMEENASQNSLDELDAKIETVKGKIDKITDNFEQLESAKVIIEALDDVELFSYFNKNIQILFNSILDKCEKPNLIVNLLIELANMTRSMIRSLKSNDEAESLVLFYDILLGILERTSHNNSLSQVDLNTLKELIKSSPLKTNLLEEIIKSAEAKTPANSFTKIGQKIGTPNKRKRAVKEDGEKLTGFYGLDEVEFEAQPTLFNLVEVKALGPASRRRLSFTH